MPRHHVQPNKPYTKDEYRAIVSALVPEKTKAFLVETWYPDEDYDGNRTDGGKRETKIGRKRIIRDAVAYYETYGLTRSTPAPLITEGEKKGQKDYAACKAIPPQTLDHVFGDVGEQNGGSHEFGAVFVMSVKQVNEMKEKELRRKGEEIAGMICSKYDVKGGTLKFINACYKHYKKIVEGERHYRDDPERRAERWAEYQFAGAGGETFWADNDYASEKICEASGSLETVIEYLEKFSPLLMTRYREVVARRKQNGEGK